MRKYNHQEVEKKWQKAWEDKPSAQTVASGEGGKGKLYVLDMFPYPSGAGLHAGHVEGYTATDIYSRFKRMQGYNVMHPMGWDAFGLPAENYAVKTGVHPKETTETAIKTFKAQMKKMGFSYDWSKEIGTHTPEYYKWTQWFFLLLYNSGLAYKTKANVNWCPSCQTVLANEQVVNGKCERCGTEVTQKELEQWFFKITDFAEDLIADLDKVDWPSSTKFNQRNWIGKSEGAELKFKVQNSKVKTTNPNSKSINVFTTRPDTLFGATYMVLAPEHELVEKLKDQITNWSEVENYRKAAAEKSELERTEITKAKTGVELRGIKAINPGNKEEIPVWIADYVLVGYGTGAIMAVPGHDQRDLDFVVEHELPVNKYKKIVVVGNKKDILEYERANREPHKAYTGVGFLRNSGEFDRMLSEEAKWEITKAVGGKRKTNYHLRDWLVSRQRYWGAPIPIVYDPVGKPHAIPEKHLPWLLPTDVEFKPTGVSPLAESAELKERTEKIFGKGWKPEVDTMDTFVCSSWYYYRFADPSNKKEFASKQAIQKWLPVDLYMGGAEHTVLHLLYARFFTKALKKLGYIEFDEPFLKLRHQGTILGEDGHKMSKSRGNVANPDEAVEQYGADTLRMYEMFLGPIADMKPWNTRNIIGLKRFLDRVWAIAQKPKAKSQNSKLENLKHKTIKKVTEDVENLRYNTAIAALMEYSNEINNQQSTINSKDAETLLMLLAPFAPHITEELWEELGNDGSIHEQPWPRTDEKKLRQARARLVLQVNGKVRDIIEVDAGVGEQEAKELALNNEKVETFLGGKPPKKIIFVPDKLVNVVV